MSLRIAVLSTCVDAEDFYRGYPDESEQIKAMFSEQRPKWAFSVYKIYEGHYPLMTDYDAFVFSGSPSSVNEDKPWITEMLAFIRTLYNEQKTMVGICFGHQAIAKALGGQVDWSTNGWSLGSVNVEITEHAEWMQTTTGSLQLYAAHSEQVIEPPLGSEILAKTQHCAIAAYRIGNQVFTTQHHPEMTEDFVTHLIHQLAPDMDKNFIEKAAFSMQQNANSSEFASWLAKFIEIAQKSQDRDPTQKQLLSR